MYETIPKWLCGVYQWPSHHLQGQGKEYTGADTGYVAITFYDLDVLQIT